MVTAKVLLRGEPGVDFVHVFGLVFAAVAVLTVGVEVSQYAFPGLLSIFVVLLIVSIIVFFTSNVMYEWGKGKSAIFASVFAVSYIGLVIFAVQLTSA